MNSTLRIFKAAYRSSFAFIRFTSFSPRYIRGMSNKPDEFRRTVFIRWSSTHKMSYLLVIFMPITIIANSGVFTAIPRPAASPFSIKELPIQRGPCHLINSTMRRTESYSSHTINLRIQFLQRTQVRSRESAKRIANSITMSHLMNPSNQPKSVNPLRTLESPQQDAVFAVYCLL